MPKKKNNKPFVSVIIPVYNEEKYIDNCLRSLEIQTFRDYEIIVVNDGSTDSTAIIAASRSYIRLISLTHGGPGRAKNEGAKLSKGKILVFIDADMFLDKDYLTNIIRPIVNKECIGTFTTSEYVSNKENMWSKCWNINLDLSLDKRIHPNDKTKGLAFRAILKEKFLSIGGFDTKLGYIDDRSLSRTDLVALPVSSAKCYHYNPDTLKDVFFSARWIGRSAEFKLTLRNIAKYSIFNSIRNSLLKIRKGAPVKFIAFKVVFDFGILAGLFFKNSRQNFAK